jgi:hypothetical protein
MANPAIPKLVKIGLIDISSVTKTMVAAITKITTLTILPTYCGIVLAFLWDFNQRLIKNDNIFETTKATIVTVVIVKYRFTCVDHDQFKSINNDFLKPIKIINQWMGVVNTFTKKSSTLLLVFKVIFLT